MVLYGWWFTSWIDSSDYYIEKEQDIDEQLVDNTSKSVTRVLEIPKEEPKRDDLFASYKVIDWEDLSWNESEWQLKALLNVWMRKLQTTIWEDLEKHIWNMESEYVDELFLKVSDFISRIMEWVQNDLNNKINAEWQAKVILPEEIAREISNLKAQLEQVELINSEEIEQIDTKRWLKIWKFFRKIGIWNKKNVKANLKAVFETNIQRLNDLNELSPQIDQLVSEIKSFPLKAIEDINRYKSTSIMLSQFSVYINTILREQIQSSDNLDEETKTILDSDLNEWIKSINYLVWVLETSVSMLIEDISSAWMLAKNLRQDFITSRYTTTIAANSSQTREVLKKWVVIWATLNRLEEASLESLSWETVAIRESITQLKQRQLSKIDTLNEALLSLKALWEKTEKSRNELDSQISKWIQDLLQNTQSFQQSTLWITHDKKEEI